MVFHYHKGWRIPPYYCFVFKNPPNISKKTLGFSSMTTGAG